MSPSRNHGRWRWVPWVLCLSLTNCGLGRRWLEWHLRPADSIDVNEPPPAPDYRSAEAWAARPDRVDLADVAPEGFEEAQATAKADVFFVHPTTYHSGEAWNQPLDDEAANERVDRAVLRNQASIFNACCRVWAPRYRQATVYTFFTEDARGDRALDIAYGDVLMAFDRFLEEIGPDRAIMLAAHSQGSRHATRLLEDRFHDASLRKRLVAAYLIGTPLPLRPLATRLPDIPLCEDPDQIHCLITWNTVRAGTRPARFDPGNRDVRPQQHYALEQGDRIACVNPTRWTTSEQRAPRSAHSGGARFSSERDDEKPTPLPTSVTTACVEGLLEISDPPAIFEKLRMGRGDYHVADFNLFYLDIRRNAEHRLARFLDQELPGSAGALGASGGDQLATDEEQPREGSQ